MQVEVAALNARMRLSKHLERVEQYGFDRRSFPLRYKGHKLIILHNDAHDTFDERIYTQLTLQCEKCRYTSTIRGKFPRGESDPKNVIVAKVATIGRFKYKECQ